MCNQTKIFNVVSDLHLESTFDFDAWSDPLASREILLSALFALSAGIKLDCDSIWFQDHGTVNMI